MTEIRNSKGKKVCDIDFQNRVIEIVVKGVKTIICLTEKGEFVITQK